MKINDLSYNATGARYGYNGTHEQDKELNADGNYLDFGNFGYDTRVAMRRNQEPLKAKYPHLSGYSIFNSNPIVFADPSGNDYELKINHKTKEITVEAQYYAVNNESISGLVKAVAFHNSQSNLFGYAFDNNGTKEVYNIKFNLSIVDADQTENTVALNTFEGLSKAEWKEFKKSIKKKGYSDGINLGYRIIYDLTSDLENVEEHELGHNLGYRHKKYGLMSEDANSLIIFHTYLDDILGQAGIGKQKILKGGKEGVDNDPYLGQPVQKIDGLVERNSEATHDGEIPEGFNNGEVIKK